MNLKDKLFRIAFPADYFRQFYPEVVRRVVFRDDLLNKLSEYEYKALSYKPTFDALSFSHILHLNGWSFERLILEAFYEPISTSNYGKVVAIEERNSHTADKIYCFSLAILLEREPDIKEPYLTTAWFFRDEVEDMCKEAGLTLEDLFEKNFHGNLILEGTLTINNEEHIFSHALRLVPNVVTIDLTGAFKKFGAFETFADFKRGMYEINGIELAGTVILVVYDYIIQEDIDTVTLILFYEINGNPITSPGFALPIEKTGLDVILEKIRKDLNLPEGFDMYRTLEHAKLEVSPDRALLYLNL